MVGDTVTKQAVQGFVYQNKTFGLYPTGGLDLHLAIRSKYSQNYKVHWTQPNNNDTTEHRSVACHFESQYWRGRY